MASFRNIFWLFLFIFISGCATIERHHGHIAAPGMLTSKTDVGWSEFNVNGTILRIWSTTLVTPILAGVVIPVIPTPFCWNSYQRLKKENLEIGIYSFKENSIVQLNLSSVSIKNPKTNEICKPTSIIEDENYRKYKSSKFELKFDCKIENFQEYELSGLTVATDGHETNFLNMFKLDSETVPNIYFDKGPGICQ